MRPAPVPALGSLAASARDRLAAIGLVTVLLLVAGMAMFGSGTPTSRVVGRDLPPSSRPGCGPLSAPRCWCR